MVTSPFTPQRRSRTLRIPRIRRVRRAKRRRTRGRGPVTTNATCSPMSTALSPIRSSARATSIIVIAHSRRSSSVPISTARRKTSRLSALISLVLAHEVLGQRHVAQRERLLGLGDLRAGEPAHLEDPLEQLGSSAGGSWPTSGMHLGDVHALVAHPLGVLDHVQQRRDGPQVAGHRRLQREQREDPLVDLEEAAVDPVVVVRRRSTPARCPGARAPPACGRASSTTRSSAPSACSSSPRSSSWKWTRACSAIVSRPCR